MPNRSGRVSYARWRVAGGPDRVDESLLAAIEQHTLRRREVGPPPEVSAGWVAGRHVLDDDFDPEEVVFGRTLLLGVRIDTNKIPSELRKAYRSQALQARAKDRDDGRPSRADQREAREEAEDRCRQDLASGRFVRSKLVPVLWNVSERTVLAPAFGDRLVAVINDLFQETFEANIEPMSAGAVARERLERQGRLRDFEDLAPSSFTSPPAAAALEEAVSGRPTTPWALGGPEPHDFLGNEFLLWLWHRLDHGDNLFNTPLGSIGLVMDQMLEMQCAWDATGKQSLRADGPARLPEARVALAAGKWPRKAGLILSIDAEEHRCTMQADRLFVTGVKLPDAPETATTERARMEARVEAVERLDQAVLALYDLFLEQRLSGGWSTMREQISRWIAQSSRGHGGGDGGRPATASTHEGRNGAAATEYAGASA